MSMRKLSTSVLVENDFWSQMTGMRAQNRISQSMLFTAPKGTNWVPFLDRLLAQILCPINHMPCGACSTCLNILQDTHSDIYYIRPEAEGGTIKIEQIRAIQNVAYQTPQLGYYQCIVIQPAEALNLSAASALLKVLEEPPPSTVFILISSAPSLLLPTILSRCQRFQIQSETVETDPLALGRHYPEHSPRAVLYDQRMNLLSDLDRMIGKQDTVCTVTQRWSDYALTDLLWFLQSVTVKLIHQCLDSTSLETDYQPYAFFTKSWRAEYLFVIMDTIRALTKKIQQNIPLNSDLVLERVLLTYLEGTH